MKDEQYGWEQARYSPAPTVAIAMFAGFVMGVIVATAFIVLFGGRW